MTAEAPESVSTPRPMQRILRNFGLLLRGRGIAAVLAVAATAATARALGPEGFGIVALVHAYVLFVRGLLNFQPFEAVVRFGVPLLEGGRPQALKRLLLACVKVDALTSLAAAALAIAAAPLAGWWLDWERPVVLAAMGYSAALLASGDGTAKGLLRLFDRFDALGNQLTVGPLLRAIGAGLAWSLHAGLWAFIAVWALAYWAENLYLIARGWWEYRQRIGGSLRVPREAAAGEEEFPGLRRFLWITYWQSNLDLLFKHLPTLLAGALLGSAGAGLFRLARDLAGVLAKPAVLVRQVVFLDLTRAAHRGDAEFAHIAYRTALIGGAVGLLFVLVSMLVGAPLLEHFVGAQFLAAAPVLSLLLLGSAFDLAGAPLRSAAYAIGRAGGLLRIHIATTALYLVLFAVLTEWHGLPGAGVATAIASAAAVAGAVWLLWRHRARGG